jgi:ligand-binding sensor domain-containing protein/signal transduction histidine kinase
MKARTWFAAVLGIPVAFCWAQGQPNAPLLPAQVTTVTVDPKIVGLPVVEGSDIRFVRLRRSEGLSQQRVTNIVQDTLGFLWFGTQHGLDRYDGYSFKVFKNDRGDATSLCGVYISSLFVDREGRLWVGCEYALDRYDPITETFVHYRLAPSGSAGATGSVRNISQDREGVLWLSTGDGLYRLDPATGATTRYGHEPGNLFSLDSNDVQSSEEDQSGTFWVATGDGLDAFDRRRARVTVRVPLHESRNFSFYEDREGVFWILYASGNGLAVLDRRNHRLTRYSYGRDNLPTHPLTGVSSMLEDQDGNLWIGTFSDGLLKFNRRRRNFTRYRYDPTNDESLSENRITTLFEDREGDIWVGLGASEPAFFSTRPSPFQVLPFDSSDAANLGEKLVDAIYVDRTGIIWMGTTGALVRLDRRNRVLAHLAIPGKGIASDVLSIVADTTGALWIGTSGQGLYYLSAATGSLTQYRHRASDSSSLSSNSVYQVRFDHTGALWVATAHGLDRFDGATRTFKTFRYVGGGAPGGLADFVEDSSGVLWVATQFSGVLRLDRDTGHLVSAGSTLARTEHGYARVESLFIDHTGALWAATENGADRYNRDTGKVTHYSETNGLASNDVSCILEDSSGGIWMGTSSGLSYLDPERQHFSNYSQADGLPGPDFTGYRACFRSPDGEMFFGGFSGAVAFRPDDVPRTAYVPPVVLTSFELFGKPVDLGPGSPLNRAIDYTDQLTLTHDQNSFSFGFSALSFQSPSTNRYRFRLDGLDRSWQEVGSDRRYATYTTLPPGQYRFRLQGATLRGPWGDPGLAVYITVKPAWWQTPWFRALAVLSVLFAVAGLYASRVRELHRRFDIRLKARDGERARIARELHDSLLQSFQGLLIRLQAVRNLLPLRPQDAASGLEAVMELADKAMDEGRAAVQDLRVPAPTAGELVQALMALGEELQLHGQEGGPSYDVVVEGHPQSLPPLIRDEIYRIAREAVRNAAEHAQARRIEAEVAYGKAEFVLRVRDDGVGVDPQILEHGRVRHWGLQGMRERAECFGARLYVWTKHGAGTEIELRVPARISYGRQTPREV